jgi:hypothetical protein
VPHHTCDGQQKFEESGEKTLELHPTVLDKETAFRAILRLVVLAREKQVHLCLTIYGGTVMMLA